MIILRLQGLDVKAGTKDVRRFFKRFHIPDGGVYIVGGSLQEAFIAFTLEKHAQLALRYSGRLLKGSKVSLHISSMAELEKKLKYLLKRRKPSPPQPPVKKHQPCSDANVLPSNDIPFDANTLPEPLHPDPDTSNLQPSNADSQDFNAAFFLGMYTIIQGLQSTCPGENNEAEQTVDFPRTNGTGVVDEIMSQKKTPDLGPGYVRLFGLPASTKKQDICQFFQGLTVQEAIVDVELGRSHACLVKFANTQDAFDALYFNQQSLGPICVEVRAATEKMWTSALQECEAAVNVGERVKTKQKPLTESAHHRKKNMSALQLKRQFINQLPSKLPKKPRADCDSITTISPAVEYNVMVNNLHTGMTKTEIKELFGCPNIAHTNVLHLLDKEGNRSATAFLIFECTEDYDYAMNLNGCHVGSDIIEVSSITKKMMKEMMAKTLPRSLELCPNTGPKGKRNPLVPSNTSDPAAQTCLFVRNLPADVQESHIQILFSTFRLKKNNIILLRNSNGESIGEALVQFKSPKLASLARRLHGLEFQGTTLLLTCITMKQMEDVLAKNV
ncbi:RNA binding motif protein 12Ba [Pseudochaenichthys georgianus]|uniref:RNA binding motif protein 12Ba n=1 Tax=Pseudochaenichthys georgianus TaxID=52239 RepID=UPI00146C3C69|nr:RNA binding motif protein 12Ba [Pseudochaenichthys georgianus]